MKSACLIVAAVAVLLAFSGCLQVEKVVKLKTDGSGTIEETVILSNAALASMQQMLNGFGAAAKGSKKDGVAGLPDLMDEAKLKAAADKMGEGVTFVSATKIDDERGQGFTAIYAFSDINKLTLDQNPGEALPEGGPMKAKPNKKELITFHFTKGNPAEVDLKMPAPDFKAQPAQPRGMDDMALQMMRQMFKDLRLAVALEVEGAVAESNAEYRDGSRVTLMNIDFNKILANPEKFKALARAHPQSVQEAKALLKEIDGVQIEDSPEVKIKFQ
jgi:hypothetical protein